MKKSILALAVFATSFAACKKDSKPQSLIVGKWYLKKTVTSHHFSNSTVQNYSTTGTGYTDADWVTFNSNGTWEMSPDLTTNGSTGTYSINGNQMTTQYGTGTIKLLDVHNLMLDSKSVEGNDTLSTEQTYTK